MSWRLASQPTCCPRYDDFLQLLESVGLKDETRQTQATGNSIHKDAFRQVHGIGDGVTGEPPASYK